MIRANAARTRSIITCLLFLALPFLILFWYIPLPGGHTLANDYIKFAIGDQLRLFYSINKDSFPMFIPGFAGGHYASALTLGQLYHPISWLAYFTPGYWSGYALVILTFLRMLTLGIAHHLLFRLCRRLRVPAYWAFLCSFIAVYNMRMLDCFRYGAALEAYTGYIFAAVALGWAWLSPSRLRWFGVVAALYWTLTSGHAQMAYYALLGSGLFVLFFPFIAALLGEQRPAPAAYARYATGFACAAIMSVFLAACYLLPFYIDFVGSNALRVGRHFLWALEWSDSVVGTLSAFYLPMRSDVHGNFGSNALVALLPLLPLLFLLERRLLVPLTALWCICAIIVLAMMGGQTPVYFWVWKYLPMADSFRAPGRLSLMLPVFFCLLLLPLIRMNARALAYWTAPVALIHTWLPLISTIPSPHSPYLLRTLSPWPEHSYQLLGSIALLCLLCGFVHPSRAFWRYAACLCIITQTCLILSVGTWSLDSKFARSPTLSQIDTQVGEKGYFDTEEGYGMSTRVVLEYANRIAMRLPAEQQERYLRPPLATLAASVDYVAGIESFYTRLERPVAPGTEIIEEIPHPTMPRGTAAGSIDLSYYSYNRSVYKVRTESDTYLVFGYPDIEGFSVTLDGAPARLVRANGIYLAVKIPSGKHTVELHFKSDAQFAGMLISLLAAAWLSVFMLRDARHAPVKMTLSILLLAVLCLWWQHSLYNGQDLHRNYHFQLP